MPKRSRKVQPKPKKLSDYLPRRDANQSAFAVLQKVIAQTEGLQQIVAEAQTAGEKNPLAVALGRLGGLKGGHARAAKLTGKERSESARNAAEARWGKKSEK